MYLNVLFLPLLNFLIIFFLGFYIGRNGSCFISAFGIFFTFITSIYIFFEVTLKQVVTFLKFYDFIYIDLYSIEIGFLFDAVSSIMLVVISFISCAVHFYSITYLGDDPYISRFMSYLSLFTFSRMGGAHLYCVCPSGISSAVKYK